MLGAAEIVVIVLVGETSPGVDEIDEVEDTYVEEGLDEPENGNGTAFRLDFLTGGERQSGGPLLF